MKIHECIGLSESAGTESDGRRSETFLLRTSVACTQSQIWKGKGVVLDWSCIGEDVLEKTRNTSF